MNTDLNFVTQENVVIDSTFNNNHDDINMSSNDYIPDIKTNLWSSDPVVNDSVVNDSVVNDSVVNDPDVNDQVVNDSSC